MTATPPATPVDPLTDFIRERIDQLGIECRRLRDKGPLLEYRQLFETMFAVRRELGTPAHEVALDRLNHEYRDAWSESKFAWGQIWESFRRHRGHAEEIHAAFSTYDTEASVTIREIESSLQEATDRDPELTASLRHALDAMKRADAAGRKFASGWNRGPWLFLWADLWIYTVYARYLAARCAVGVLRHSFIIAVAILLFGIGYSKFRDAMTDLISSMSATWPWLTGLTLFGAYLFKKYYVDSKVKKLQVRFETRLLSKLAVHLHFVRAMALLSRTHARGRGEA